MSQKTPNIVGIVTVGTKGQIVIPSDVREIAGIESGDRLFVLTKSDNSEMIGLCTEKGLEDLMANINQKLTELTEAVSSAKEKQSR